MRRIVGFCIALVVAAPGCGDLLDPAAAVVNDQKITVDEIAASLERFERSPEFERLAQQGDAGELKRQVEQQLLSQEIRRAVLEPKAESFDIEVTEEDVERRLDQIKQDFPSEGAFEEALKEQGLTLEQLHDLVRDNLLEERLRARVTEDARPSEEELRAHFETNADRYRETEAQHILVEDRATARRLARQLQRAPSNRLDQLFARLARRHSTDPSAESGGELGTFRPGDFVPSFEEAADELAIGEVSDPVKTRFGFHVIRVTGRSDPAFEDVVEQIEQELGEGAADRAWETYVAQAYEDADVKVNPRYGEFDDESFQVVDPTAEDVPGAEERGTTETPGPQEPPTEATPAP